MVYLDSGQSADESAFLDLYRYRVHCDYQKAKPFYGRFWIIYPTSDLKHRHGWVRSLVEDKPWMAHHTRPRKFIGEDIILKKKHRNVKEWVQASGIARSFAKFEPNIDKFTPGMVPNYRAKQKDPTRRATVVMLAPSERDFEYITTRVSQWHRSRRIPRLVLGSQVLPKMPSNFHTWLWATLCFEESEQIRLKEGLKNTNVKVRRIDYRMITRPKGRHDTANWSFPGAFGHAQRIRKPEMGNFLYERAGLRGSKRVGSDADAWQTVESLTDCRNYVILTHQEGDAVPFDAMIALARGARIIAPDIPLYRAIETSKKALFPCRATGHNGASWSPVDLAGWFHSRFGIPH